MIYPYDVKHNGTWYPAGTDVPVGSPVNVKSESVPVVETEVSEEEPKKRGRQPRKK